MECLTHVSESIKFQIFWGKMSPYSTPSPEGGKVALQHAMLEMQA